MYVYSYPLVFKLYLLMESLLATHPSNGQYGYRWMRAAVRSRQDTERTSSEPRDKLKRYIESPLEDVNNVVAWWGVSDR